MRGIEIGTHVEGEEIASPRLDPFWAEVERLGAVVVVHTQGATAPDRLQGHNFVNILGHPFEATLAQAHLIFDGVIDRHPASRSSSSTAGATCRPTPAGSTTAGAPARTSARGCRPPGNQLRNFYFDTMVFETDQLKFLVDRYGADHVLLGTDYPYDMGDEDPLALVGASAG